MSLLSWKHFDAVLSDDFPMSALVGADTTDATGGLEICKMLLDCATRLTQEGMVNALMVTRSTIQKHLANLKSAGRIRRVGPDKGGHWEVLI